MFSSRRSRISKFIGLSLAFLSYCSPNSYAGKVVIYVIPDYPYCCKKKIKGEEVKTVCCVYKDSDLKRYEFDFNEEYFGYEDLIKIGEKIGLNFKFMNVNDAICEKEKKIYDKVYIKNAKKSYKIPFECHANSDRARIVKIELPDCIKRIGVWAFTLLVSLVDIKLPSTLLAIENSAFKDCRNLDLKLLGTCQKIEDNAFYHCYHIIAVDCKDLDEVGELAFYKCLNLEKFDFSKVAKVGDYAFANTGLVDVELGERTSLSEGMFMDCKNLIFIKMDNNYNVDEDGDINIPDYCFYGCKSLIRVKLAKEIKHIGKHVFAKCYSLNFVDASKCEDSLEEVHENAFCECYSLVNFDAKERLFGDLNIDIDPCDVRNITVMEQFSRKAPDCINFVVTLKEFKEYDRCVLF